MVLNWWLRQHIRAVGDSSLPTLQHCIDPANKHYETRHSELADKGMQFSMRHIRMKMDRHRIQQ